QTPADRRSRPRGSIIVRAPIDHCPPRTRHPDAVAVDRRVELAAALVLQEEGVEGGEQGHDDETTWGDGDASTSPIADTTSPSACAGPRCRESNARSSASPHA